VPALTGPFLAAAALLVAGGAGKARHPVPLQRALRTLHLPASAGLVRGVALAELLIGLSALLLGGVVPALLVALSYAAFAGFVGLALARGGVLASCGCFGRSDTPPTGTHLVLTAGFALVGAVSVVSAPPSVGEALGSGSLLYGVALLLLATAITVLAYLLLAELPQLSARARAGRGTPTPTPLPTLASARLGRPAGAS